MDVELLQQPDSTIARATLNEGEELVAQAGAMVAMSGTMHATTSLRRGKGGGLVGGLKRLAGGESLFLNTFRSPLAGGEVWLAPKLTGDLVVRDLAGSDLVVQAASYLFSSADVDLDVGFRGFQKALFSGESPFWLELSGQGMVAIAAFGGIYAIPVAGEYLVDTGHIVAFEHTLDFDLGKPPASSWASAFLGGERLVCRFRGRGTVYCQTHSNTTFGRRVGSRLPPR